jgi:hypothetical protein
MPNDFVLTDKFSNFLDKGIEKVFETRYNDVFSESVNGSDITQCDRRIHYKLMGEGPPRNRSEDRDRDYFLMKWACTLREAEGFDLLNKQFLVADHNYNVSSFVDFVGSINSLPVVLKVEEVSDTIFQSKNAKRPHVVELMTQMWLAEINDGFLIYENAVSKMHSVFHIVPNVSVLNSVKNKLRTLTETKLLGIPPERKYEASDALECQKCFFVGKCWS